MESRQFTGSSCCQLAPWSPNGETLLFLSFYVDTMAERSRRRWADSRQYMAHIIPLIFKDSECIALCHLLVGGIEELCSNLQLQLETQSATHHSISFLQQVLVALSFLTTGNHQ